MDTKNMRALLINVLLGLAVIAAVFAAIGGGWSIAQYTGILPLKKAKKAVVIDETPITVENVKAIGELVTANYYDEAVSLMGKVIVKETLDEGKGIFKKGKKDTTYTVIRTLQESELKDFKDPRLILIQTVHARIGSDLSQLDDNALKITEATKTVDITIPDVQCLDFIANPSDTEVFDENGYWNLDELKKAMAPTKQELWDKMISNAKLFDSARQGVQEVLTQLFQAAGYKTVTVHFKTNPQTLEMPKEE